MLWATVNEVTMRTMSRSRCAARSKAMRNAMWSYPTKMWCIPQRMNSVAVPKIVGLSLAAVRSSSKGPYWVKIFCTPPHETMTAA